MKEKLGTQKTLCSSRESERHIVTMCIARTIIALGSLIDVVIGLGVEWYKSGEQIIWSVAPVSSININENLTYK